MNHSMYSADRTTHLKIVVAALIAATALTGFALSSRLDDGAAGVIAAVKTGRPVVMTSAATTSLTR